jgi:hypothetical protein
VTCAARSCLRKAPQGAKLRLNTALCRSGEVNVDKGQSLQRYVFRPVGRG